MSVRQGKKIIKDFSELKVVERIQLSALGIYQVMHVGKADEIYKPRQGTQVFRVWKMGKLSARQQRAWQSFRKDVDEALGASGSVTGGYGEYTDRGSADGFKVPVAYTNVAYQRLDDIYSRHLGRHERALLRDLLWNDLRADDTLQLEIIGFVRSGYSGKDKDSARASGVTHVQNLLDRLADYFGI